MWLEQNNIAPIAANLYLGLTGVVVLFQLALASGAPWGHLAMGGKYPGRFPVRIRLLSIFNAAILLAMGGVVAARTGLYLQALKDLSAWVVWIVVVLARFLWWQTSPHPASPSERYGGQSTS